jgi:hypothetical protein
MRMRGGRINALGSRGLGVVESGDFNRKVVEVWRRLRTGGV